MVWIVKSQGDTDDLKTYLPMEYLEDGAERIAAIKMAVVDGLLARFRGPNHEPFNSPDWDLFLREDLEADSSIASAGYPFPQIDRPLSLRLTEPIGRRKLPDIIDCWLVPDEVRDMIEAIEPKTHVFWPVELYHHDGVPEARRRWGLRFVGRRDTIAVEKSNVFVKQYGEGKRSYSRISPKDLYKPKFVKFWKDKVAGHAIWWEYRFAGGGESHVRRPCRCFDRRGNYRL